MQPRPFNVADAKRGGIPTASLSDTELSQCTTLRQIQAFNQLVLLIPTCLPVACDQLTFPSRVHEGRNRGVSKTRIV